MLWRVRTTLSDRPGALAGLAHSCGLRGANILGMQIFPGVQGVTDELVMRVPESWTDGELRQLVEGAGGRDVVVAPCTPHALADAPTRYLQALRHVVDDPGRLAPVLADLLDAEPLAGSLAGPPAAAGHDLLSVSVGDEVVTVARQTGFTPTEHARAAVFAEVAADLLGRSPEPDPEPAPEGASQPVAPAQASGDAGLRLGRSADAEAVARMVARCSAETLSRRFGAPDTRPGLQQARRLAAGGLLAVAGQQVVGLATLEPVSSGVFEVGVLVEDGWQRRGVGTRLLSLAARTARADGAQEVVVRTRPDNPAVLGLVMATGLCGRVRHAGEQITVTASLRDVKPLPRLAASG